tara:strand:- start:9 stop:275 length:267 start_codon:yes stop_codon:yes gene_type:complete
MKKKPLKFILLILFLGCVLATSLSLLVGLIIPDGVVKDFFTLKQSLGFNWNEWIDLGPLRFKAGFEFDISILSVLGICISWYILRYFK